MTSLDVGSTSTPPDLEARYAAIRDDLTRAVARVCPAWLRDRQDDLVQCAVLRVMDVERKSAEARKSPGQGEGNRDLSSSYLYRVAYSAMIDEIRRIRRRGETDLPDPDVQDSGTMPEDQTIHSPAALAEAAEQGAAIRDCLGGLIPPRRAAVTLYLAGHTVPESSRILRWTLKKTENLVYRGLADLRQCLLGKGIRP